MPLGEKERQDREVFQRNMKIRMETYKSSRYKRHKKERSLKKVRKIDTSVVRSFKVCSQLKRLTGSEAIWSLNRCSAPKIMSTALFVPGTSLCPLIQNMFVLVMYGTWFIVI